MSYAYYPLWMLLRGFGSACLRKLASSDYSNHRLLINVFVQNNLMLAHAGLL